jgi:hypothetical protein
MEATLIFTMSKGETHGTHTQTARGLRPRRRPRRDQKTGSQRLIKHAPNGTTRPFSSWRKYAAIGAGSGEGEGSGSNALSALSAAVCVVKSRVRAACEPRAESGMGLPDRSTATNTSAVAEHRCHGCTPDAAVAAVAEHDKPVGATRPRTPIPPLISPLFSPPDSHTSFALRCPSPHGPTRRVCGHAVPRAARRRSSAAILLSIQFNSQQPIQLFAHTLPHPSFC